MKLENIKIGDRVVYCRGLKEVLYNQIGLVLDRSKEEIIINSKNYYLFWVKFDNSGTYECMADNLDLVERK